MRYLLSLWLFPILADLSPSGLSSGSNSKGLRQQTAFRDVILEEALKEVFENLLAKIKEDKPGQLGPVLRDPLLLPHGLSLAKRSDLADLKLTASHMSVSGLRDLKLTYIRIVRHFGLSEFKLGPDWIF